MVVIYCYLEIEHYRVSKFRLNNSSSFEVSAVSYSLEIK